MSEPAPVILFPATPKPTAPVVMLLTAEQTDAYCEKSVKVTEIRW